MTVAVFSAVLFFNSDIELNKNVITEEKSNNQNEVIRENKISSSDNLAVDIQPIETTIETSEKPEESIKEEVVITEEKIKQPQKFDSVWSDANPQQEIERFKPTSPYIENIKAVEITDINQFKALNEGDVITMSLPSNDNIDIQIDNNEFQNEGIRMWSGNFELEGQSYPVTFTFGKTSILGFIGHPEGQIKIEGKGSSAWVYELPANHGFDH
ncbi:hypothetical protein FR271_06945 [Vibrio vulnificus]|nr:hypothetical protein VVMO6_03463 [Vibrio vulnificus MO6-24/O]EGR0090712.1 hypothetical protein [Vibrio vulnificus]EGR7941143.1 hypothetical protein [Vibrio vulnificus]EHU9438601.1 hypothetical protein [Vibrio vulnificus]EID4334775.1 hypothetical protein [Vibrio vulnificus]